MTIPDVAVTIPADENETIPIVAAVPTFNVPVVTTPTLYFSVPSPTKPVVTSLLINSYHAPACA